MSFLTGYVLGMMLNKNQNGSYHERDFEKEQLKIKCQELERQVERLQEQLKEANEVIKTTNRVSGNIDLSQLVYEDRRKIDGITMQTESYLEKWGVK